MQQIERSERRGEGKEDRKERMRNLNGKGEQIEEAKGEEEGRKADENCQPPRDT